MVSLVNETRRHEVGPIRRRPYLPQSRDALLARIVGDMIDGRELTIIEGRKGVGKTTFARALALALGETGHLVVKIDGPSYAREPALHAIFEALGFDTAGPLYDEILLRKLGRSESGIRLVLIIDDIEHLPEGGYRFLTLMIALFSCADAMFQVVLFGDFSGWEGMLPGDMTMLQEAVSRRATIAPLKPGEARLYLAHKTRLTGRSERDLMTKSTARALVRVTGGSPEAIDAALAEMIARPRLQTSPRGKRGWTGGAAIASISLVVVCAGVLVLMDLGPIIRYFPWRNSARPLAALPLQSQSEDRDRQTRKINQRFARQDAVLPAPVAGPTSEAASPHLVEIRQPGAPATIPVLPRSVLAPPVGEARAEASSPQLPSPSVRGPEAPRSGSDAGLASLQQIGDTMKALCAKLYRGRTPSPFAAVLAANPGPIQAGTLMMFPEPPGGWDSAAPQPPPSSPRGTFSTAR